MTRLASVFGFTFSGFASCLARAGALHFLPHTLIQMQEQTRLTPVYHAANTTGAGGSVAESALPIFG